MLVLPAHGQPFRGAHERLNALTAEHLESLEKLLDFCDEPRLAVEVFPALFRVDVRRQDMLMFATGEAIAHLHYLMAEGEIERFEEDGRYRYRRISS